MRKILSLALVAALGLSVMTGCNDAPAVDLVETETETNTEANTEAETETETETNTEAETETETNTEVENVPAAE